MNQILEFEKKAETSEVEKRILVEEYIEEKKSSKKVVVLVSVILISLIVIAAGGYVFLFNNYDNTGTTLMATFSDGTIRSIRVPIEFRESEYMEFEGLNIIVVDFSDQNDINYIDSVEVDASEYELENINMDVYIKLSTGELEIHETIVISDEATLSFSPTEATKYILVHVPVDDMLLNPRIVMNRNDIYLITPTILPENSTNKDVVFTLVGEDIADIDNEIVHIDEDGFLASAGAGQAIVRITIEDEPIQRYVLVTVRNIPDEIILEQESIRIEEGQSRDIVARVIPEDAVDRELAWASLDDEIASVDEDGRLTAHSPGSTVIVVQTKFEPPVTREIQVEVTARSVLQPPSTPEPTPTPPGDAGEHRGPTYINGILIVNRQFGLPPTYNPGVNPQALAGFNRMRDSAASEGLTLTIISGFRSYQTQREIWERRVRQSGEAEASRIVARPGHSEHQTGLAFDINSLSFSFAYTAEGIWLANNAHRYGFIIRYPENSEHITGFVFEPWHIRYVGTFHATNIFTSGITLEEYLGLHY
ncbi:MAG: D-alanyl-D-alanine carboxypeptidase family protein [Oscillospiraceae bacterium]|nr:D-alanyl-D-alanine carboxypeptidase family protein [Oscillospiraceae bacterium]